MNTLMDISRPHKGLYIIKDFVTESEETEILSHINIEEKRKTSNRNTIQRYGSNEIYKDNGFVSSEIPMYLHTLSQRCARELRWRSFKNRGAMFLAKQITVNQYYPNQKIDYHIDSKDSGELISVISLCSDCEMSFKKEMSDEIFTVTLPRRSLMALEGELRWKYYHAILNHREFRVSIVLRNGKTDS